MATAKPDAAKAFTPTPQSASDAPSMPTHPRQAQEKTGGDADASLEALANATYEHDLEYPRGNQTQSPDHDPANGRRPDRRRMARGANASMVLGIIAVFVSIASGVLGFITTRATDNENALMMLGALTVLLVAITTLSSMMAITRGQAACRTIRKTRRPLSGKDQAVIGMITGAIALLVVFALSLAGSIWLVKRGGLQFEEVAHQDEHSGSPVFLFVPSNPISLTCVAFG